MQHSFDVEIASKYGVNCAIILNHIYFWVEKNRANNKNYYDGCYWTYNSKKAFSVLFPYLNERQIDYTLKKLIDEGLIVTGNYNENPCDRTLWYAITNKGYSILQNCEMQSTKLSNASDKIVEAIPYINTNINTDINIDNKETKESDILSEEEQMFEMFWQEYPKKINKKGCFRSFKRIKNLKNEFPNIMFGLQVKKKSKQWNSDGGQYIPHPQTFINQERWKDSQEETREEKLNKIDMDGWI